jgi:hypothetical protein
MQSKRFRNEQFCKGDLVSPNWNTKQPIGIGLVLNVEANRWDEKCITVCWQLLGITKESPIDLNVLEQSLD